MTENKRCSVMLPPELEERIRKVRQTDACCMMSLSEIIRMLIDQGLEQMEKK